ncbi:MAG: ATP-dependent DNA ligase, partial [Candidatus Anstonellales archaeon]
LKMTEIMAQIFKSASVDVADKIVYLAQGMIAPAYEGIELGVGEKFTLQAISLSCGYSRKEVEELYKKRGDLGLVAEELVGKKKQASLFYQPLSVEKVFDSFMKLAKMSGEGSQEAKIKTLSELLNHATPLEARYLIRFAVGNLRLGIGDATIIDALSYYSTGDKSLREKLERAYNICSDLGFVAKSFIKNPHEIGRFRITPFRPIRPALAEREASIEKIIERLGKCGVDSKYDGLRMQVHKKGNMIEIYSRKLEKVTPMFPEIVEAVMALGVKEVIFEGEALAFSQKEGRYLSFQTTVQRKRKYGVEEMSRDFPLRLFVFDVLEIDGTDMTLMPFSKRREELERLFKGGTTLQPSELIVTDSPKEIATFFEGCIKKGLEGIIAKDLNAPYIAGARKFAWIKLKKSYGQMADTIDAVIVGYYLGKGQRAEFKFGGILAAVWNDELEKFETIARVGSGFTEDEMQKLQGMLKKIAINEKPKNLDSKIVPDFWCRPRYVISITADEISHSPMHTCGFENGRGLALRFPRILAIREDKGIYDVTTTKEVKKLFEMQTLISHEAKKRAGAVI